MPRLNFIQSALDELMQHAHRSDDAFFSVRVEALDALESYALELAGMHPAPTEIQKHEQQRQRVLALSGELQSFNEQMFKRYREMIASGNFDRSALTNEFACLATPMPKDASDNLTYDALDILIAGILHEDTFLDENPLNLESEMISYEPTPARAILELIRRSGMTENDLFYDIGSGLGHVPMLVSLLTGTTAVGVEVQSAYCKHAQRCAARLHLERVQFIHADARAADFSSGTIFYLYTPFTGEMLHAVLAKLHAQAQSRAIRVCTYGPYLADAIKQSKYDAFEYVDMQSSITLFKSAAR